MNSPTPTRTAAIDESRLMNRLALRLMPLLGVLYLVAYIDRSNVGFAKLQMLGSLGLSEVAYGLGASLFFIGYLIFEIPSNVMLHKYGAPRWIARIMLTWGIVTILLAFTKNATMFYVLRFLLGASEAGLYPGVIYYLTLWFPARHRVRMLGYFTLGSSIAREGMPFERPRVPLAPEAVHHRIHVFDVGAAIELVGEQRVELAERRLVGRMVVARHRVLLAVADL